MLITHSRPAFALWPAGKLHAIFSRLHLRRDFTLRRPPPNPRCIHPLVTLLPSIPRRPCKGVSLYVYTACTTAHCRGSDKKIHRQCSTEIPLFHDIFISFCCYLDVPPLRVSDAPLRVNVICVTEICWLLAIEMDHLGQDCGEGEVYVQ